MLTPTPRFVIDASGRKAWELPGGRTVPYVAGGAGDEPAPEPAPEPTSEPAPEPASEPAPEPSADPGTDDGDKPLGPAGEKALAAWKERAKAAEAKVSEFEQANLTEQERAVAEAEARGKAEGQALAQAAEFRAELRVAAADKLNKQAATDLSSDAALAMKQLGFDEVPVTATGDIDAEAISAAIDAYVEARPYLAGDATPPPSIDQGSRTPAPNPSIEDAIAQAEANGDWKTARQLKARLTFG